MTAERIRTAAAEMRSLLDQIRMENGQIERQNLLAKLWPLAERLGEITIEELEGFQNDRR